MKVKNATNALITFIGFVLLWSSTVIASPDKTNLYSIQASTLPADAPVFVDKSLTNFPRVDKSAPNVLQLFSHGRPGELLLDGKWRDAPGIVAFIQNQHLINSTITQLNIYGCEFGKGAKGKAALAYIQGVLSVQVAASNNITGRNGDWILEEGKPENVLSFFQYEGNLQYSGVDDTDGDGILNVLDIDDDNDGILDAVEAPSCYYNQQEASDIIAVTSDLTFTASKDFAIDGSYSTVATLTNTQPIAGKVIFLFQFALPVRLNQLVDSLNSTTGIIASGATYRIEASNSANGPWDDVSGTLTAPATPGTGNHQVWSLTATQPYRFYRIFGISGNTAAGNSREFIASGIVSYSASTNPKPTCNADLDNDGINNDKDLDSDGDGCPDAKEANVYNISGVTMASGNIKNGSGGVVSSTTNVPNAIVSGPYGGNGFSNILQLAADTNAYKYTYNTIFLNKNLSNCADLDGDGITDIVDIDDDNDGILDAVEAPSCYYSQVEAGDIIAVASDLTFTSPKESSIDGNNATFGTLTSGQDITNKVIFQFQFASPLRLTQLTDTLA